MTEQAPAANRRVTHPYWQAVVVLFDRGLELGGVHVEVPRDGMVDNLVSLHRQPPAKAAWSHTVTVAQTGTHTQ